MAGIVIFDMDGTLIDSMPQHAALFGQILNEQRGIAVDDAARAYLATAGQPLDAQFRHVLQLHDAEGDTEALCAQFFRRAHLIEPTVFSDVPPALEELRQRGYVLAVVSSSESALVEQRMVRLGLAGYFRWMLGTDHGVEGLAKGDGHFRIIRRGAHLSEVQFRAAAVLVGDSEFDMHIAIVAGLTAIGRGSREAAPRLEAAGARYVLPEFSRLVSVLDRLAVSSASLP